MSEASPCLDCGEGRFDTCKNCGWAITWVSYTDEWWHVGGKAYCALAPMADPVGEYRYHLGPSARDSQRAGESH